MRGMLGRDFHNDMVDGKVLKASKTVKNRLKMGANAGDRILSLGAEHQTLLKNAPRHLQAVLTRCQGDGDEKWRS